MKEIYMRFSLSVAAVIIAASACTYAPASASQQTADMQQKAALMKAITTAFNAAESGNIKVFHEQYTASTSIADEFAPFTWTGPNAQDRFFADFGKALAELKMTDTKLVAGSPKYLYVSGTQAYVVLPVTVTAKIAGKPYNESGWMAITLRQAGGAWKIATQTWAKGIENFNPY